MKEIKPVRHYLMPEIDDIVVYEETLYKVTFINDIGDVFKSEELKSGEEKIFRIFSGSSMGIPGGRDALVAYLDRKGNWAMCSHTPYKASNSIKMVMGNDEDEEEG